MLGFYQPTSFQYRRPNYLCIIMKLSTLILPALSLFTRVAESLPANAPDAVGTKADDYPYTGQCGSVDEWNYYACQCTSFVAWRINERLDINFHNQYKGYNWGNANTWDEAAKATGVTINNKPAVGAVAQSNAGGFGHVAWVSAVDGGSVTVEEYNYETVEAYGTRTVAKGEFNYIHV